MSEVRTEETLPNEKGTYNTKTKKQKTKKKRYSGK